MKPVESNKGAEKQSQSSTPALVVRGNRDHSLGYDVDPRGVPRYQKLADITRRYSASLLKQEQKEFLRAFPLDLELNRQDTRFYLCHAKPSDPRYGYCPEKSEEWVKELQRVNADVLLVRHTHIPFVRTIGDRLVVNPGSLGQPKTGKPDANYAICENGSFQLKSFPYAVDTTIGRLKALAFPIEVEKDFDHRTSNRIRIAR